MAEPAEFDEPEEVPEGGPVEIAMPVAGVHDESEVVPDFSPGRKPVGYILSTVLIAGTLGGLHFGADRKLHGARYEFDRCSHVAMYEHDVQALEQCRPGRLLLPSLWPVTRRGTQELRLDADYAIDEALFAHASRLDFDRPGRERALERLLDNPRFMDVDPLLFFDHHGAHAEILSYARELESFDSASARGVARDSALLLGEVGALGAFEAKPGRAPRLDFVSNIALACLLDADAGVRASKPVLEREAIGEQDAQRLVLLACQGLADNQHGRFPDPPESRWTEAWLVSREASFERKLASVWLENTQYFRWRSGPLAQAILHEQPTAAQLLRWLAPLRTWELEDTQLAPTPALLQAGRGMIALRPSGEQLPLYDPAGVLSAAQTMAKIAVSPELDAELAELADEVLHPQAYVRPRELLTRGAVILASEAAREWLARGQREQALAAAREALSWSSVELGWIAAGLCALAGDGEAALEWVRVRRSASPGPAPDEQRHLAEIELRALASLGRWGQVGSAAEVALERARAQDPGQDGHQLYLVTWHEALGRTYADEGLYEVHGNDEWSGPSWGLDYMRELAAEDPLAERLDRSELWPAAAYPALSLLVATRELEDPGHAQMWADVLLDWTPDFGRELYFARAELARYRGDAEAEQRWGQAAARVLALGDTEDRVLLLHLAGV